MEKTAKGELTVEEAEKLVRLQAVAELEGVAKIDFNREQRKGIPEVILAENKTAADVVDITLRMMRGMRKSHSQPLQSRADSSTQRRVTP